MKPSTGIAGAAASACMGLLAACASSQGVDTGTPSAGGTADSVAADGVLATDAGSADSAGAPDLPPGKSVKLVYNGAATTIALGGLPLSDFGGLKCVKLSEIALVAAPAKSHDQLQISDFLAADGFTPKSKSNCKALIPVVGALLAQGCIDPLTRNLQWQSSLGYPGCMHTGDVAEIVLDDRP